MIDGAVLDGMAIAWLLFLCKLLWQQFVMSGREKLLPWAWPKLCQDGVFFLTAGLCIGWLWP